MAANEDPRDHDQLVRDYIVDLRAANETIQRADVDDWERPEEIDGHRPDILTDRSIVEVETCDAIRSGNDKDQWRTFDSEASESGMTFVVAVPAACVDEAKTRMAELGLNRVVQAIIGGL